MRTLDASLDKKTKIKKGSSCTFGCFTLSVIFILVSGFSYFITLRTCSNLADNIVDQTDFSRNIVWTQNLSNISSNKQNDLILCDICVPVEMEHSGNLELKPLGSFISKYVKDYTKAEVSLKFNAKYIYSLPLKNEIKIEEISYNNHYFFTIILDDISVFETKADTSSFRFQTNKKSIFISEDNLEKEIFSHIEEYMQTDANSFEKKQTAKKYSKEVISSFIKEWVLDEKYDFSPDDKVIIEVIYKADEIQKK